MREELYNIGNDAVVRNYCFHSRHCKDVQYVLCIAEYMYMSFIQWNLSYPTSGNSGGTYVRKVYISETVCK